MTKILHPAGKRGHEKPVEWLDSYHSFSFGDWFDPKRIRFGKLRVLNDDTIGPGGGFPPHPHSNMEIVTIVLEGELKHQDSIGTSSILRAGEVQRMSAGTGVVHSEYNANQDIPLKLFQIWVETKKKGITPSYEEKAFQNLTRNSLHLLVSPEGREGSVSINQDAFFSITEINKKIIYKKHLDKNIIYIMIIEGEVKISEETLGRRDAIGIENEDNIEILPNEKSRILIIEIPS